MVDAGPGGSARLAMRKSGMRRQSRDVNAGQVSQPNDVVAQLKSDFASKTREAEVLKNQLKTATGRSDSAIHLLAQLSGKSSGVMLIP